MDRPWRLIIVGALIVVIAIAGAVSMTRWFASSAPDRRPNLVEAPPLAPVTRSSVIVTPAAIALSAIQEALEKAGVPHQLITVPGGKHGGFSQPEMVRIYTGIHEFLGRYKLLP